MDTTLGNRGRGASGPGRNLLLGGTIGLSGPRRQGPGARRGRRPSSAAPRPGASPPTNGVLRERDLNRAGSTVHRAAGSNTTTSAGAPRRSDPPARPQMRAGAVLIRSISADGVSSPRLDQFAPGQRERRLQADDAVRRIVELPLLGVVMMRRVVAGDAVDGAVGQRLRGSRRGPPPRAAAGSSWRWCRTPRTARGSAQSGAASPRR